jgi:hypothetical protein
VQLERVEYVHYLWDQGKLRGQELSHCHQLQDLPSAVHLGRVVRQPAGDTAGPVGEGDCHHHPHQHRALAQRWTGLGQHGQQGLGDEVPGQ